MSTRVASHALVCALVCAALASSAVPWAQSGPAVSGPARRLVLDPPPNTRIAKTIRIEHALETLVLGLGFGGESLRDLPRMKLVTTETLSVDDEYRACADGRPTSLWRAYREVAHDVRAFAPGGSEPLSHLAATSPLTGLSVVFTWVPEERGYGRIYDALEGVEEALASLTEELDLRGLLPVREVRVGERWDVDPAELRDVLAGGGRLPLNWTPDPEAPALRNVASGIGGALYEVFGDKTRGKVSALLASVSQEGQDELAHVELSIEIETDRDQTELIRGMMTRAEVMRGSIVTRSQVNFRLTGQATLVWNLTQRRVQSFDLSGIEEINREIDVGGGPQNGGQTEKVSLKGPLKIALTSGPPRSATPIAPGDSLPPEPEPGGGDSHGGR